MSLKEEKQKFINSLIFPFIFVLLLWIIHFIETQTGYSFVEYGLFPRKLSGLLGIITSPLIHSDWDHLLSNTTPLLVLGSGLWYYYQQKSYTIFFFIYFLSGLWAWFFARPAYHIGASGIVYGLIFFLVISALIKKETKMMFFSFLIIFLYGSVIWGFFPDFFPGKNISWECHLTGAIAGIVAAFYFRKYGPQQKQYFAEEENNDEDDNNENSEEPPYWMQNTDNDNNES